MLALLQLLRMRLTSAGSFANTNWIIILQFDSKFPNYREAYNQDALTLGRNKWNNSSKIKYFRQTIYDVMHSNSYQANITKTRNCSQKHPLECKRLGETKTSCNLHKVPDANFASTKLSITQSLRLHTIGYAKLSKIVSWKTRTFLIVSMTFWRGELKKSSGTISAMLSKPGNVRL